jgi:hypothetical protein
MKTITIADIRSWDPCYDPIRYLPENWSGTILDILRDEAIPLHDRRWVVFRTELISERTLRLFAVWCAREALKLVANPDSRFIEATNVAERFANGKASLKELNLAWSATKSAAWSAESAAESAGFAQRDKLIEMILEENKLNEKNKPTRKTKVKGLGKRGGDSKGRGIKPKPRGKTR